MDCPRCGHRVQNGANFCDNCGTALYNPREVSSTYNEPSRPSRSRSGTRLKDPYSDQIKDLKLQIKQLKLYLRQITNQMSSTRARYHETAAFIPFGLLSRGYKWFEDLRLLGPQQQKEQLQRQILQMEQDLLGLQQAQERWKRER